MIFVFYRPSLDPRRPLAARRQVMIPNFLFLIFFLLGSFVASQTPPPRLPDDPPEPISLQQPEADPCAHERDPRVTRTNVAEPDGGPPTRVTLAANHTRLFFYENHNVTTMNQPDEYRHLVIRLEPCDGIPYLYARRTRRCFPNPYNGEWTHFKSVTDGTRDGAPSNFEVPLESTKYFFAVYAKVDTTFDFLLVSETAAFPAPGNNGTIFALRPSDSVVELSWNEATYKPPGYTTTEAYHVYSALMLDDEKKTNEFIMLNPSRIMNTVCGLERNTERPYRSVKQSECDKETGKCSIKISGVTLGRKYLFNVVVESRRGLKAAYEGVVVQIESVGSADEVDVGTKTASLVTIIGGSIIAVVVAAYLLLIKIYA